MKGIKRILVPTDFSENATSVFKFVRETAKNYNAKVDLIHIIPNLTYLEVDKDEFGNPFNDKDKYTKLRAKLSKRLEEELKNQLPEQYRGKIFVNKEDRVSEGLINHSRQEGYDLIMIASRGRGQSILGRGSVTEKLIRLANTPVLSVNKGYDPEIKTVLVPTDGSQLSLEALPIALLVAHTNHANLRLLYVSRFDSTRTKIAGRSSYKYSDEEIREYVMRNLRKYVKQGNNKLSLHTELTGGRDVIKLGGKDIEPLKLSVAIRKGVSPQREIVEYALENAQVVVMATHGREGVANLLIGSTTEKVARMLRLPVLTIRPEEAKY